MLSDDQRVFLEKVLQGDSEAIHFCETIWGLSQIWDDLVDGDKDVTSHSINRMMWDAMVTLPNNPFYRYHFDTLNPLVQSAIVDWVDSNELAKGNVNQKCAAYVLRDTITTIVIHCARLIGGYEWMREISMEVRTALYNESVIGFIGEHK